jgi:hypothetical protein
MQAQQNETANLSPLPTDGDVASIFVDARNRTTLLRYPGLTVLRRVWDVCMAREVSPEVAQAANAFALRVIRDSQPTRIGDDDVKTIGGLAVDNTLEGIASWFDDAIERARSERV